MAANVIHILPEHLANKIAAGEVIQRPESVVKELLENALDAGATRITVAIEEAGKKLIRVSDNGGGMTEADAVLALQRHATSKIRSDEDLAGIVTFGFRGEALSSVAAVAQVTIRTRHAEDQAAIVVTSRPGTPATVSHDVREAGTTITVQNLFFNVPARRKFLRSNPTEFRHIYEAVHRVAIAHPNIALRFVSDGETVLDLHPATEDARVIDLLGDAVREQLIPVSEEGEILYVHGYVGKPSFSRRGKMQNALFLNKRPIFSKALSHAVFSAYEHLTLKNPAPVFLLFLEVDPERVDVNVHPSKIEVKFEDEQAVYGFIHSLVRKVLSSPDLVPALAVNLEQDGAAGLRFTTRQHRWPAPSGTDIRPGNSPVTGTGVFTRPDVSGETLASLLLGGDRPATDSSAAAATSLEVVQGEDVFAGPVFQLLHKYIIVQISGGMMIVDQHVAHERILYERILERFAQEETAGQQMLFPVTMELNAGDAALMHTLLPVLAGMGFFLRPFGKHTFLIEAMPPEVSDGESAGVLEGMLGLYRDYQRAERMEPREALAKSFSCRAAIKAGQALSESGMRSLLVDLFKTRVPLVCPHGRPTVMRISEHELDRRFGRT
jgi:DNA mismatch repair protein MutL